MIKKVNLSNTVKVGVFAGALSGLFILILAACSGPSSSTSTSGSATSSTLNSTLTSTTQGPTYSQFAAEGQVLYPAKCSLCHGDNGQGGQAPAIIGSSAALAKYSTAQGLLEKISNTMPMNSPGSLSRQQYLQLAAYLLTQNNYVGTSEVFNEANLKDIPLK